MFLILFCITTNLVVRLHRLYCDVTYACISLCDSVWEMISYFFQIGQLRKEELMRGIDEDDVEIHRYERILGYNKRKSKKMPKVFRIEGLDCACFIVLDKYNLLHFYFVLWNLIQIEIIRN